VCVCGGGGGNYHILYCESVVTSLNTSVELGTAFASNHTEQEEAGTRAQTLADVTDGIEQKKKKN